MKDLGSGFPEWTELGQDGGLDPLGMQRPIEAIYQSLLPGISTITLRFRYYSFFVWMLEVYAKEERNTNPAAFRVFQRRCETVFALICARGSTELGVAGIDWAQKQLAGLADQADGDVIVDFSVGADPEAEISQRYLRNKGGAFGGIYATQMFEMGLITLGNDRNPISVCTNRALPLAEAFGAEIGHLAKIFLGAVRAGRVSLADLDRMSALKPSEIVPGSAEHGLLVDVLLGKGVKPSAPDKLRRSTTIMLLQLIETLQDVPRAETVKWEWFGAGKAADSSGAAPDEVRTLWALYQACDLMRLAYENVLDLALDMLMQSPTRRMSLDALVAELLDHADAPDDMTWREFSDSLVADAAPAAAARHADLAINEARAAGDRSRQMRSVVALVAALSAKAVEFGELLDQALNAPDHFHSLRTETRFLRDRSDDSARSVVAAMFRERVLKRHLWVASRKFRNQKAYTFLMEPEEGVLRYRDHFRVSPSSPRLEQAMGFLRDAKLLHDARISEARGLTEFGRAELRAA